MSTPYDQTVTMPPPASTDLAGTRAPGGLAELAAHRISAWFGDHKVLDRVSLTMPAGRVTALIGPSGCGKSTFLRILNRMHELVPAASLAGEVLLDGRDLYHPSRRLTEARREVGMVFQKPNPFPAMSIYDNVTAGLKLTGTRPTELLPRNCTCLGNMLMGAAAVTTRAMPRAIFCMPRVEMKGCGSLSLVSMIPLRNPSRAPVARQMAMDR